MGGPDPSLIDVDTTLPGDHDGMLAQSDALDNATSTLAGLPEKSRTAYGAALEHWEGGGRRVLFKNASAGTQAELLVLVTAVSSVADLVETYMAGHKTARDKMDEIDSFWSGKLLEYYGNPDDESIRQEVAKAGHEQAEEARTVRRDLHRLAHLIAADIDQATNLLLPGGASMRPEDITRKVQDALGRPAPGSDMTLGEATGLLETAADAIPPGASRPDGEFDLDAFLATLNDGVGAAFDVGGTGWALHNLIAYRVGAAELARRTDALYAEIIGQSLAELQAGRLAVADHVTSILRYVAAEDDLALKVRSDNAALLAELRSGGRWTPALGTTLAALGLVGDVYQLRHLDEIENPTEREVVKWATIANALGLSTQALEVVGVVNSGDAIPVWGEAVATATGIFLAGYFAYKTGPVIGDSWWDQLVALTNAGDPILSVR